MYPETQIFEFEQNIKATPAQVYHAFTNATALKGWLCDIATLNPKPGGRIYLAWNSGYYMSGEYLNLEADNSLSFSWYGRGEPAPTRVEIHLAPTPQGTLVKLAHSEVKNTPAWSKMIEEISTGWSSSLENLASRLESGPDLRIVKRPMLGIILGDLEQKQAETLGVPTSQGIRLDDVVEGMGAQKAGLQKDDVIIAMAGQAITDYADLATALNGKRAGDSVEVVFYRGPQKMSVSMELSGRPMPEIPQSVPKLAEVIAQRYAGLQESLDQLLEGVSEAEAVHKPSDEEWSAKEVLAHLIHGERDGQAYVTEIIGGQESWSDDYAGNLPMRTQATLVAYPSLAELHTALKSLYAETIALYQNFPPDLPETDKGTYWGLAYYAVQPPYHEYGHFEQIKAAIEAARK